VGIRTADWSRLGLREELREELRVRSVQPLAAHVDSGTSLHAPCAAGGALSRAGICACRSRSWGQRRNAVEWRRSLQTGRSTRVLAAISILLPLLSRGVESMEWRWRALGRCTAASLCLCAVTVAVPPCVWAAPVEASSSHVTPIHTPTIPCTPHNRTSCSCSQSSSSEWRHPTLEAGGCSNGHCTRCCTEAQGEPREASSRAAERK
jgi:hypothetical protein